MAQNSKTLVKGASWTVAANIAKIMSGILVLPLLARVLSASDFGLMQMAMPVILLSMVFNDAGIGPALVRAEKVSKQLWSTALWTNVMIGLVLAVVVILLAPLTAFLYGTSDVVAILIALSALLVVQTLGIVPFAWLQREMKFKSIAGADILSHASGILIAVILAFNGAGVWALVWQQLTIFIVRTSVLWIAAHPPVVIAFVFDELKPIISFSVSVTLSNLVNLIGRNGDYVILGSVAGATALGFYSLAYRLMLMPVQVFSWGISAILLPGMSAIQSDRARLAAASLRVYQLVSLLTFPIMAGAWALSDPLVIVVLGSKMEPVAELLAILAAVGAMQSMSSSHGPLFMAIGRADVMFRWSLFVNIVTVIAFLIGARWGAVGVASAYLIMNLVLAPPGYFILFRLIELPVRTFIAAILPTTLVAIAMAILVRYVSQYLFGLGLSDLSVLLICVPLGAALYGLGILAVAKPALGIAMDAARQVLSRNTAAAT